MTTTKQNVVQCGDKRIHLRGGYSSSIQQVSIWLIWQWFCVILFKKMITEKIQWQRKGLSDSKVNSYKYSLHSIH